jgi:hypothetical protein
MCPCHEQAIRDRGYRPPSYASRVNEQVGRVLGAEEPVVTAAGEGEW